jgi:NADH-quinone oxidoreductase subunit L
MPQTFITFLIGTAALAGIPPLAGFWSKDEILANAGNNDYVAFLIVGAIGAFLTAAYMTRCVYLTFFGEYRGGHAHDHEPALVGAHAGEGDELHEHHLAEEQDTHLPEGDHAHAGPHESNWIITAPLWILSAFSVFIGFLNAPQLMKFEEWVQPTVAFVPVEHASFSWPIASASVLAALLGVALSWLYYQGKLPQRLAERNALAGAGKKFLVNKYYLDWLYTDVVVAGIKGPIAAGVYWFNQHVIDNVLNYTGRGARALGRVTYDYIDQKGVDGIVNGIGVATGESGSAVRRIQTGRLQLYALMLVAAVVIFAGALWIFT